MQKLMGFNTIMKLLKGLSYVTAYLFHVDLLLMDENEILMSENLTLEEDMALVGLFWAALKETMLTVPNQLCVTLIFNRIHKGIDQ